MQIRQITEQDSDQFLALCQTLDQETQFMMLEPGERTTTPEEQRQRIATLLTHENQMIFVAEAENQLVGYLGVFGENFQRNRHGAYVVIGILQAYTGQGIGKQLFQSLEAWALQHKIHRLELTVMCHNERGVKLYQKMGFQVEGVKRDSLRVNGKYVDEYYMAKLLEV